MEIIKYKKIYKKKKFLNILTKFLSSIQYGFFGIKSLNFGILTVKQIETLRRIFVRLTKRTGKLFIRVIFQQPLTFKPISSRMGKGVGSIKKWVSYIKKGTIFLEILGIKKLLAIKFFKLISIKLSIKVDFIVRENFKLKKIA